MGVSLRMLIGETSFCFFLPGFAIKVLYSKAAVTFGFIFQLNDAPDAAAEQTVKFFPGSRP